MPSRKAPGLWASQAIGELGEASAAGESNCELEVAGDEGTAAAEYLVQLDVREERETAAMRRYESESHLGLDLLS